MKQYSMKAASQVAKQAAIDIELYLKSLPYTLNVLNVENDDNYRTKDIDLLWTYQKNHMPFTAKIEVKGDRYFHTGNYFLETISNKSKNTPGCFMYTEANYVFYYFIDEKELHVLPMPYTREWFIGHILEFKETSTSTPIGRSGEYYLTVGRLVPRNYLIANVPKVHVLKLNI